MVKDYWLFLFIQEMGTSGGGGAEGGGGEVQLVAPLSVQPTRKATAGAAAALRRFWRSTSRRAWRTHNP